MKKYVFDINIGHYVLNEDDNTNTDNNATQQASDTTVTYTPLPTLNTQEVATERDKMNKELDIISNDISRLTDNKVQLENTLAKVTEAFNTAEDNQKTNLRNTVIDTNDKLLQVQLDIAKKEKDKADKKYDYIQRIIQLQKSVNEASKPQLPEKYRYLNESNIHTAKIYMRNLIANDEDHIIKGMNDFKRAFGNSELLYGKDKQGYFVVCVDQDDFNKMYDTLEETGYMRDFIIDNIMPQLFDRKEMIQ